MQGQLENSGGGLKTVKEVAQHLKLSVAAVYNLMNAGQLPFVKIGKSRRVTPEALKDLVERSTVNGAPKVVA